MPQIAYDQLIDTALRGVVRTVLEQAAESGLSDGHHFYLTFRTQAPGVEVPEYLRARYPEEMTIVLEHEFWGLDVNQHGFAVTLAFGGRHERLVVPFVAITGFADPSVKFGLQFHAIDDSDDLFDDEDEEVDEDMFEIEDRLSDGQDNGRTATLPEAEAGDNVVALDRFRKR
ncbi:ClpXP protease specificity-enhancing factor SspB [Tistrella mobilis]|uniref:SspB family protein n=1 Tax=Tistrella mobilis TaxID=171437 RepID=UPI0035575407